MKITITIDDLKQVLNKPVDEITEDDQEVIEGAKENLPAKEVKLPKDESMVEPGGNAKPVIHVVKKGETLKDISNRYGVSYGELSNHLMNTEGNTSLHDGQKIEIPRHFIDLTEAK
jgi:LysM repeat protein